MENLSSAKSAYRELINGREMRIISTAHLGPKMLEIQRAVSQQFGTELTEMRSAHRGRVVARPRQVAMYLCQKLTDRSTAEIGRAFGNRDHATVIHAIKRVEQLMADDPDFKAQVLRARQAVSLSARLPA